MTDQVAGHENAGHENARHENAAQKQKQKVAQKQYQIERILSATFSCPAFPCPAFSCLAFSCPATWSVIFMSCNFMPATWSVIFMDKLWKSNRSVQCSVSVVSWCNRHFHVRHFQSTRKHTIPAYLPISHLSLSPLFRGSAQGQVLGTNFYMQFNTVKSHTTLFTD